MRIPPFLLGLLALGMLGTAIPARAALPNPVLTFDGTEDYEAHGKAWVRYKLSVTNRASFAPELFTPAPDLPPCGLNKNSARTWVEVKSGARPYPRLYGFCALDSPEGLGSLWFSLEKGRRPPSKVFIEIIDRQTGEKKTSARVATH